MIDNDGFVFQDGKVIGFVQRLDVRPLTGESPDEVWEARKTNEISMTADYAFPRFGSQDDAVEYLTGGRE